MRYFYLYRITSPFDDKYYLGVHGTSNLADKYLGSGSRIKKAIKEKGKQAFYRTILDVFETEDEMYEAEQRVVTHDVLTDPRCLNLKPGGYGGWPVGILENASELAKKRWTRSEYRNAVTEKTREWSRSHLDIVRRGLDTARALFCKHMQDEDFRKSFIEKQSANAKLRWEATSAEERKRIGQAVKQGQDKEKLRQMGERRRGINNPLFRVKYAPFFRQLITKGILEDMQTEMWDCDIVSKYGGGFRMETFVFFAEQIGMITSVSKKRIYEPSTRTRKNKTTFELIKMEEDNADAHIS